MSTEKKNLDSYAEWAALPDTVVGEMIAGDLTVSPRPGAKHARAASGLGGEIFGPFDRGKGGPGGWWIYVEPELHLGGDIVVPDLAGWKRERLAQMHPDQPYFDVSPDWVCEILSKSTAGFDRVKKLPVYAREKVGHVWLIDPTSKTLDVFQLQGSGWFLLKSFVGDERIRAEPFDAVEIDLGSLWLPDSPESR